VSQQCALADGPREFDHGRIRQVPLSEIKPAPENDTLYRPVVQTDPEVIALAQSIRKFGVQEPLIITRDNVIVSGHRRRVAARMAGLKTVPCLTCEVSSGDPDFLRLLREHNRQRMKTLDEVAREEIISANPDESYRVLLEHRREESRVGADTIAIEGKKCRAKISLAKYPMLLAVRRVLEERREFWPLTDRQIHYALLNDPPLIHASKPDSRYANNLQSYKALVDLLTRARLEHQIKFNAISDPTRPVTIWRTDQSTAPFIRKQLDGLLKNYSRDLLQSQPNHIEILGEKNTIASIIRPVSSEYCMPMTLGRGYSSLPPRFEMFGRFRLSGKERLVLLILSDFDPEGEDIVHSFARSMRDDFGVDKIDAIKVALTADQVAEMELPPDYQPMKAKTSSSRYKKFVERHGENAFELEAIPPRRLQELLRTAINSVIDVEAFNREIDAEKKDAAYLDGLRRSLVRHFGDIAEANPGADKPTIIPTDDNEQE
jgi:hypothetical protein